MVRNEFWFVKFILCYCMFMSIFYGCFIIYNLYFLRDKVVLNLFEFYYVVCLGSNKFILGWLSFLNLNIVLSVCICKLSMCIKK